jgi:hypothetical protein
MNTTDPSVRQPVPLASVDRFECSWGVNGAVIALGNPAVTANPLTGRVDAGGAAWFLALALSPNTLKQLRDLTIDAVSRYEQAHGSIASPAVSVGPPAGDNVISLGGPHG